MHNCVQSAQLSMQSMQLLGDLGTFPQEFFENRHFDIESGTDIFLTNLHTIVV